MAKIDFSRHKKEKIRDKIIEMMDSLDTKDKNVIQLARKGSNGSKIAPEDLDMVAGGLHSGAFGDENNKNNLAKNKK